ncbi:stage V sporulation protein AA [Virgibacillus sp. LDC-1]|uniref:stage V sporulation protein AA n=1 Tax=Virgibacillus sp. LDC-1 TaxID=3039856 RepID=UPI0024DEA5AF|nr:stage V sporulation protein AA [Virgibacillus sp. LDC-1]
MKQLVYIRMKKNLDIKDMREIRLKDIAYLSTLSHDLKSRLENMPIYRITKKDNNLVVIDSFLIVEHLTTQFNEIEIQLIGPTNTVIRVHKVRKHSSILLTAFAWIILFIGTAMTIVNFHYDVSMQVVQQRIHYLLTGEYTKYPLWLQIPYSFGLGAGMLLFFNHWFNKRFNEEPSPLEVEIFNYQQSIDNYIGHHENIIDEHRSPH